METIGYLDRSAGGRILGRDPSELAGRSGPWSSGRPVDIAAADGRRIAHGLDETSISALGLSAAASISFKPRRSLRHFAFWCLNLL